MRFWGPSWRDRWPTIALFVLFALFIVLEVLTSQHLRLSILMVIVLVSAAIEYRRQCRVEMDGEIASLESKIAGKVYAREAKESAKRHGSGARAKAEERLLEGRLRLAEYAFARGAVVEAHYQALKAHLEGEQDAVRAMSRYRRAWTSLGCPECREPPRVDFTEEQIELSMAVLLLHGVDAGAAKARLERLADGGCADATLFLRRIG